MISVEYVSTAVNAIKTLIVLMILIPVSHAAEVPRDMAFPDSFSQRHIVLNDSLSRIDLSEHGITIHSAAELSFPSDQTSNPFLSMPDFPASNQLNEAVSTTQTNLLISTNGYAYGLAYDPQNQKIYWTSTGDQVIKQANVNGTEIKALLTNFEAPYAIEVSSAANKTVYALVDNKITMSTFDSLGNFIESISLLNVDSSKVHGLALSNDQGTLFFCDQYGRLFGQITLQNFDSTQQLNTATFSDTAQVNTTSHIGRFSFNYANEVQ